MKVRDQSYMPREMARLFRATTRVFDFRIEDFTDYKKQGNSSLSSIRAVVANHLFKEYGDHELVSYFTGVPTSKLKQWKYTYSIGNKRLIVGAIEDKLKLKTK